jgi:hypothetical protein
MRRSVLAASAACLAAAFVLVSPREARAGFYVGGEFDAASSFGAPEGYNQGFGFVGQLGYRIGLGPVFLAPEAQGSYLAFPYRADTGTGPALHATRVLGGARFGLGGLVQPQLYGHAGVGWLGSDRNGRAFDGGFALGFKLIPYLRFGAQVGYNVVTIQNDLGTGMSTTLKWLSYGVHAGLEF